MKSLDALHPVQHTMYVMNLSSGFVVNTLAPLPQNGHGLSTGYSVLVYSSSFSLESSILQGLSGLSKNP